MSHRPRSSHSGNASEIRVTDISEPFMSPYRDSNKPCTGLYETRNGKKECGDETSQRIMVSFLHPTRGLCKAEMPYCTEVSEIFEQKLRSFR